MPKKRKKYTIIAYSPDDEYEFPQKVYLTLTEMAKDLKIDLKHADNILRRGGVYKKTQLKYMKVKC